MSKIDLNKAAIKARLANQIRKDVYLLLQGKTWNTPETKDFVSEPNMIKMFTKWFEQAVHMHGELHRYKKTKKKKKAVHEKRLENGYYKKKADKKNAARRWKVTHDRTQEQLKNAI